MANTVYIEEQLRGLYPTSQKINAMFIAEIGTTFLSLGDQDFKDALDRHRQGVNAGQVPTAKTLRSYCATATFSDDKLSSAFVDMVINFGWSRAINMAYGFNSGRGHEFNSALRDYLIRVGINNTSEPFHGLSPWQELFISELHAGNIVEAYSAAAENAPPNKRPYFLQKAKWFGRVGNEAAKMSFTFHRSAKAESYNGKYKDHYADIVNPHTAEHDKEPVAVQVDVDDDERHKDLPF